MIATHAPGYRVQTGRVLNVRGPGPEMQSFFGEVSPPQKNSIMNVPHTISTSQPHPRYRNETSFLASKPNIFPQRGIRLASRRGPTDCVGILRERIRDMLQLLYLAVEDEVGVKLSGQLRMDRFCGVMEEAGLSLAAVDVRGVENAYCRRHTSSVDAKTFSADLLQLIRRPAGCYERMPGAVKAIARRLKFMGETMEKHWERKDMETMPSYEEQRGRKPSGFVNQDHFLAELKMCRFPLGPDQVAVDLLQAYDTDSEGVKQGFVNYKNFLRDFRAACSSYFDSGEFEFAGIASSVEMFPGSITLAPQHGKALNAEGGLHEGGGLDAGGGIAGGLGQTATGVSRSRPHTLAAHPNASPLSVAFDEDLDVEGGEGRTSRLHSIGRGGSGTSFTLKSGLSSRRSSQSLNWSMDATCRETLGAQLSDFWPNMQMAYMSFNGVDYKKTGYVPGREFEGVMKTWAKLLSLSDLNYLFRRFGDNRNRVSYDAFFRWAYVACPDEFSVEVPKV